MKKQFGLPLMLASALAFSACSSDDVAENGPKDISALTNGGYLKMSINLPSRAASAFKANDDFNDGLAAEYNVKDATLILFQGNDEASARFHSAYMLSTNDFNTDGTTTNQVTSTKQLVKSVKGDVVGDNLYALVVLNKNNVIQPQPDHTLKVNSQDFFGNFEQLQKTVVKNNGVAAFITDDGFFFMTNAPLATAKGGTSVTSAPSAAEIKTLVKINQNIYSTEDEANRKPAADIYVERGVAKVTMQTVATGNLEDEAYKGGMNAVSYTVDAWGLDITNESSYFARVPNIDWNGYTSHHLGTGVVDYRFIGFTDIASTGYATPGTAAPAVKWYRTYWGQDPNYLSADASNDFKLLKNNPLSSATVDYDKLYKSFGSDKPLYCLENTFDVDNMKQDRSTRVVVRAQLSSAGITAGQDFYTVNGGKSTLYSKANLDKMVQKAIFDHTDVKDFITAHGGTFSSDKIVLTYSTRDDATGEQKIEDFDVTIGSGAGSVSMTPTEKATALADVNNQIKQITCYKEGYAYYPIIIKHFGKDQTPWGLDKDNTITGANIYPATNRDANYLGRYGVLRNNWYDLEVTGIRTIGSAVIPSRDGTKYDDELNQYISVKINVLSWAKRKQSEKL